MENKDDQTLGNADITQQVGWGIDKGLVRDNNEDSLAAVRVNQASGEAESQSVGIYAVADGMGGHSAGEIASKLAVRSAIRELMTEITEAEASMPQNYQNWLRSAVAIANQMVLNKSLDDQKKMGTTLVMAAVVGNQVHIVNVGDSRAYILNAEGIRQITEDHSFVQMLLKAGAISREEAIDHPRQNLLTQSIGQEKKLTVDLFSETLEDDSYVLLCSDGLWGELTDEEIWKIVMGADSPQAACQALIDHTNAAGGHDNSAIVLVRVKNR